ncbi:MAG: Kazal-type serine protease inhibitor family protein [Cytophagaceae bacterium]
MKAFQLTLFLVIILFSSCKKECQSTTWKENCNCITIHDPVCGCDGKTYGNSCEAECQGITEYRKGACNR